MVDLNATIEIAARAEIPLINGTPVRRVKLLPIGVIEMRDGRGPFMIRDQAHARQVVAATRAWLGSADMMFDYDHQALHATRPGVGSTALAAGWVKPATLTVESDGIYAQVDWTPVAAARLAAREYRYVSPTFMAATGTGEVIHLKNAALVNIGAIDLPAVAANHTDFTRQIQEEIPAMLITPALLKDLAVAYRSLFKEGFEGVPTLWPKIAMKTSSGGAEEVYAWLGQIPEIREWLGDRRIHSLSAEGFSIKNRKFETTITVKRTDVEDDRIGVMSPLFRDMGRRVAEFPDVLLAELIPSGFTSKCYDGQYFFDTDHPVSPYGAADPVSVSNVQGGSGPAWYLLDLSRTFKPFIYQERIPFKMQRLDDDERDEVVFMRDEYIYGTRGRCNVGFGLWQLAFASKAELNADNYEAARTAMANLKGDNNRKLGIRPTTLLVPQELEGDGRKLLKSSLINGGESNPWIDSAELLVSNWL